VKEKRKPRNRQKFLAEQAGSGARALNALLYFTAFCRNMQICAFSLFHLKQHFYLSAVGGCYSGGRIFSRLTNEEDFYEKSQEIGKEAPSYVASYRMFAGRADIRGG
jgi:hypothetical protein